jgi:hypothetical protein
MVVLGGAAVFISEIPLYFRAGVFALNPEPQTLNRSEIIGHNVFIQ